MVFLQSPGEPKTATRGRRPVSLIARILIMRSKDLLTWSKPGLHIEDESHVLGPTTPHAAGNQKHSQKAPHRREDTNSGDPMKLVHDNPSQ